MSKLENKTDRCMYRQWDYDYKAFGEDLRMARLSRHLTQDDVADNIGVSRSTVWKMEHGGFCSPLTMFKVSELLGVDYMRYNIRPVSEEYKNREEM